MKFQKTKTKKTLNSKNKLNLTIYNIEKMDVTHTKNQKYW